MNEHMREIGPLLTAYAEDALAPEGRAWVEAQLERDPGLRETLAAIHAVRGQVRGSLPAAPPALDAERRLRLLAYASSVRPLRLRLRYVITLAMGLAACVVAALCLPTTRNIEWLGKEGDVREAYRRPMDIAVKAFAPASAPMPEASTQTVQDHEGVVGAVTPAAPAADGGAGNSGGGGYDPESGASRPLYGDAKKVASAQTDRAEELQQAPQLLATATGIPSPTGTGPTTPWPATGQAPAATPDARASATNDQLQGGVADLPSGMTPAFTTPAMPAAAAAELDGKRRSLEAAADKLQQELGTQLGQEKTQTDSTEAPAATHPAQSPIIDSRQLVADDVRLKGDDGRRTPEPEQVDEDSKVDQAMREDAASKDLKEASGDHHEPLLPKPGQTDTVGARYGYPPALTLLVPAPQSWQPAALLSALIAGGQLAADREVLTQVRSAGQAAVQAHAEQPLGQVLLSAAQQLHLQVALAGGGCILRDGPRPLDPTDLGGWDPQRFQAAFGTAPMRSTAQVPRLTFAFDADTASFDQARALLAHGRLPDPAAIAPEQFINAMAMDYPPAQGPEAIALYAEAGPSPFAAGALAPRTALVALGVVTRAPREDERRPLHLTLAIDTSGSMGGPDGLPLVQSALQGLYQHLHREDTVCVVRFADQAAVVLPPTPGDQQERIAGAIAGLTAGGATDGADGLTLAYQLAGEDAASAERQVVFATDGAAFPAQRVDQVYARVDQGREHGIGLMVLGCGGDDRQQRFLQALADRAHGQHCFLASGTDSATTFASRLLPERLRILARDVKIQVAWNPARVAFARLIGFDQRRLADRDFRREGADAGELAHDVQATALFEVVLAQEGSGPVGEAHVRCFDTRAGEVREQAFAMPGSILGGGASPHLHRLACAAELAELLQQGWWSNVRCATWERLAEELATLPESDDATILAAMAGQARHLAQAPEGRR